MTTIRDVARHAGVAPITVSRVLNGADYVSLDVRRRVEAAISELGYVPNSVARSLRSRRTHTLALMISDLTNPFFTLVARGVERAANAAGYLLIICNTNESAEDEARRLDAVLERRVDGLLVVPAGGGSRAVELAGRHGVPIVLIDRRADGRLVDCVRCDSFGGSAALARWAAGLGHRKAGVLAGPAGVSTADDRVRGFQDGFGDGAVTAERGALTTAEGSRLTDALLKAAPIVTLLFAANNFLAIGALRELRARGIAVPDAISLVGFDDLPTDIVTHPFLTVVGQPAEEMGERSVDLLLARIRGDSPSKPVDLLLPTELIVRDSCGAPRAQLQEI